MYRTFGIRRHLRRASAALIIASVLLLMAVSWLLDRWTELTQYFIRIAGLRQVEVWLKRQTLWLGLVFVIPMAAGFVAFKIYEVHLAINGRYLLVVLLGLVFKFFYASILHYLLHIYYEKLIAIGWIAYCHGHYCAMRDWAVAIVKQQPAYRKAVLIKLRVKKWLKKRHTRFHVARRWLRRT